MQIEMEDALMMCSYFGRMKVFFLIIYIMH